MQCEICGKQINNGIKIKIEGSEMSVCGKCSELGTRVKENKTEKRETTSSKTKVKTTKTSSKGSESKSGSGFYEEMGELVEDYPKRIQRAREKKDLKQDELAQKINEKSSLISKLEKGSKLPEEKVVSKLERFLGIELKQT